MCDKVRSHVVDVVDIYIFALSATCVTIGVYSYALSDLSIYILKIRSNEFYRVHRQLLYDVAMKQCVPQRKKNIPMHIRYLMTMILTINRLVINLLG